MAMFGECKLTLLASLLIVFILGQVLASSDYCDSSRSNVSLQFSEFCESFPEVTAACTVKSTIALDWYYDGDLSCTGICTNNNPLACDILTATPPECDCGDTVLTSQATFNLTSQPGVFVGCEGERGTIANISASLPSMRAPTLSYNTVNISSKMFKAIISWEEIDSAQMNVEYVVFVANETSQQPQPYSSTTGTEMNVTLNKGVEYNIVVAAQLCGGKWSSETSNPLVVNLADLVSSTSHLPETKITTLMTQSPVNTMNMIPSKQNQVVTVLVAVLTVVLAVVLFIILCVILIIVLWRKPTQFFEQRKPPKEPSMAMETTGTVDPPQPAVGTIGRENRQKTGVNAIHIDGDYIYYALIEKDGGNPGKDTFYVRKCRQNGKIVKVFACDQRVCGIGKHGQYLFVSINTTNSYIVKFDDTSGERKRNSKCGDSILGSAYGLLVTSDYVLVCSQWYYSTNKIYVFRSEDLVLCEDKTIKLPDNFGAVNIARFNNNYIIGGIGAFWVTDCNFKEIHEDKKMPIDKNACGENFRKGYIFRAVCASKKYIYVNEMIKRNEKEIHDDVRDGDEAKRGQIICYEYVSGKFIEKRKINKFHSRNSGEDGEVDYFSKGCPVVMDCKEDPRTGHDILFFSLGFRDKDFYIMKLLTSDEFYTSSESSESCEIICKVV